MKNVFLSMVFTIVMPLYRGDIIHMPIVNIEMGRDGFHRDLQYTVQFDYPLAGKECEYILEQVLPAAIYVSVDQLDDLKRLKKLNAIYPRFVDIEAITEKSQSFSVLLKGTPKIADSIRLPIHFRYHAPRKDGSYVLVNITNPKIYMYCSDNEDFSDTELQADPHVSYCLNEDICGFSESSASTGTDVGDCFWKHINANFRLKSSLTAKIPVGNDKAYPPVLYATIIISWIMSLWTVFRTQSLSRHINQRLQAERLPKK